MNLKNTFKKIISFTAALVLAVGFIPSISSSAAASYESGYDFNEIADMNRDLSGQFPLIEYNFDPFTPEAGHSGFGISSFFQLESEMFSGLSDFTLAFWLQLDHVVSYNERVFYDDVIVIDPISDSDLSIHKKLFRSGNIVVIENLCNLNEVLAAGGSFTACTYPINCDSLTGLPCRVIAKI